MNDRLKAEAAQRKAIIEKNMVKEEQRKNKEFEVSDVPDSYSSHWDFVHCDTSGVISKF